MVEGAFSLSLSFFFLFPFLSQVRGVEAYYCDAQFENLLVKTGCSTEALHRRIVQHMYDIRLFSGFFLTMYLYKRTCLGYSTH